MFSSTLRQTELRCQNSRLWSRHPPSWIKASVDVAVDMADGQATIEGVIRDENGGWVHSFARSIGRCSVLLTDLWALHDML
ncbi:hypothetical protein V6N11_071613 [Hibiscus sabdariffa]|uniref:RNase H type-1 domain-containing protein n=1 Tax=Hibiscus sabdariffa TaxID=183260 RepID=A0ABR2U175_9ROSI